MAGLNVPLYDPRLVQPMREELTRLGFRELRTPDDVDAVLGKATDATLVVVNSVCGCAARNARPAAAMAIQHAKRPGQLLTVFAGQDADATARAAAISPGISRRRRRSPCSGTASSSSCSSARTSRDGPRRISRAILPPRSTATATEPAPAGLLRRGG